MSLNTRHGRLQQLLRQKRFAERHATLALPPFPQAEGATTHKSPLHHWAQTLNDQWQEHHVAQQQTGIMFSTLLGAVPSLTRQLKLQLEQLGTAAKGVSVGHAIDGDRSVAILNLLWHTVSLTCRGNTHPLFYTPPVSEVSPFIAGRIMALSIDFRHVAGIENVSELLRYEIASLYVPAVPEAAYWLAPAMTNQPAYVVPGTQAASAFLKLILDTVLGTGLNHEV